jgi:hypothetical protein
VARHPRGIVLLLASCLAASTVVTVPAIAAEHTATSASHTSPAVHHEPTDSGSYVTFAPGQGRFPLVAHGHAAPLVVSSDDYPGVTRVVTDLQSDLQKVSGVKPAVSVGDVPRRSSVVLLGTIGKSPLIDGLISAGKLDVSGIAGKWETSEQAVVNHPMPGVDQALVIAGSDQRGTIYGAYDVSRGIGISPWAYWDDVAPRQHSAIYVLPGRHSQGTPAVKYRGIFINDENPATGEWAPRVFGPGLAPGFPGGLNHHYYAKVFETLLRLKANYLWPAVWGRAFAEDDPQNQATATAYGVIMGTSHEAPMMRGIEEWNRHAVAAVRDASGNITKPGHDPYGGTGEWSFRYNSAAIKAYWREGLQRMKDQGFEGVVTLGMRGNGDVGLSDGDGIDLMRQIISAQRSIIADVFGSADAVPQVWTLYKEVQRYWDKGLRVPDDVTVNFTDDNWGNIRQLPDQRHPEPRSGGYGLYYHFDYVGGGRNYKWVDTTSMANMQDQLNQAVSYGDSRLWVTNVGDLKNNEAPTQFFLDKAWNPDRWSADRVPQWQQQYAAENFGSPEASSIAHVLADYGHLQAIRKPELLNRKISLDPAKDPATDPSAIVYDDQATPFSMSDYRELDRVTAQWQSLAARAEQIGHALPARDHDAYYELVLYEVKATANVYAMRRAEFLNILYAAQGRAAANGLADVAEARFADDQAMSAYYNDTLAGGRWKDFQTQPHIDYGDVARYGPNAPWQQPEKDNVALPDVLFPAVQRLQVPAGADMGVAIDGSDTWWPAAQTPAVLPTFSGYQSQPAQYIDVFNRGTDAFNYQITTPVPWLRIDHDRGRVQQQVRATLHVDWARAPIGTTHVPVTVTGPSGRSVVVQAIVDNTPLATTRGFVEANGYVSIDADHFSRSVSNGGVAWQRVADIGRTGSGMEPFPVTSPRQVLGGDGARLEYDMTLTTTGPVKVWAYLSPRNNVAPTDGLTYAVSIDGEAPQLVNVTTATGANDTTMNRQWERNTSDNVNLTSTTHEITTPGVHTLKVWVVDPTVVVQKLVVDTGGLQTSYLGPPESYRVGAGGRG